MQLRVRHRARLEPAIEHVADAAQRLPVLLKREVIDAMRVQVGHLLTGELLQLLHRRHAVRLSAVVADPQRNRRAPEPRAADAPVARFLEPVLEPFLANEAGHPVNGAVVLDHALAQRLDAHVPGGRRLVDERRARAITERIAVTELRVLEDGALLLQVVNDRLVGLLHVEALVRRHLMGEVAARIDGIHQVDLRLAARVGVFFTERRRHVHEAGTVGRRDVPRVDHPERTTRRAAREEGEERLVGLAEQLAALELAHHLRLLTQHGNEERFGHHVALAVFVICDHVLELFVHRDREV